MFGDGKVSRPSDPYTRDVTGCVRPVPNPDQQATSRTTAKADDHLYAWHASHMLAVASEHEKGGLRDVCVGPRFSSALALPSEEQLA